MYAQNTQFKIISNQNNSIIVDFILTDYVIDDYKVLDGDMHQKIKALDAVAILKKGHPEVLKFTTNLQMPNKGVSSVNVISTSFDTKTNINLIPSKGNLYRNINPETIPYEKAGIYQQNNLYPGSLVVDGVPYIQRDVRGQTITLFPFQYNPVLKQLRVYNKVRFEVNFNTKTSGINELDEQRKSSYNKLIEDSYTRRYLNYIPKKIHFSW